MCDRSFLGRFQQIGARQILFSSDTYVALASFFVIGYLVSWSIGVATAYPILEVFTTISATFFSIVLAGLAIIVSFTDKDFILAWKQIKEFDNILTAFQWNLYVPLVVLMLSLLLRFVFYNPVLMVFLVSLFIYMICSLFGLVKFITTYGLQRGDFLEVTSGRAEKNVHTEHQEKDNVHTEHQEKDNVQIAPKTYVICGLVGLLFGAYLFAVEVCIENKAVCDAVFGISIAIFSIGFLLWLKNVIYPIKTINDNI